MVRQAQDGCGFFRFVWNNRRCRGNELHEAVLEGDADKVRRLLDQDPDLVSSRFTYATRFNGVGQEGSGEAIHVAASRGSIEMVALLLERRATLDTHVTRGNRDHYDVLHAAVFAEGRGGSEEMVRSLLAARATIRPNLDGKWPLHMAFQAGQARLIPLLREEMESRDLLELAEREEPTPLKVGIQMRKLTEEQLSELAALTPQSLVVFIQNEPRCIPPFLARMSKNGVTCAAELAKLVTVHDLSHVLADCPEAAVALLDALTEQPECESEGWHPLPSRMSFAPRNSTEWLQDQLNPVRLIFPLYQPDRVWRFDMTSFEAPDWHSILLDRNLGHPIRDVCIKVCEVPDVICAEFVAALCQTAGDDTLFIFENSAIRSVLQVVWWEGAVRVDAIQVLLSVWGLGLLVLETYLLRNSPERRGRTLAVVAGDFISARAIVDFAHEMVQLRGLALIGRRMDYVAWANAWDLLRCSLPVFLFYDPSNRVVRVLVILIYWLRLLEVNFSESMSRELLPITRLARGLVPASIVAFIGFCGLTHAYYVLSEVDGDTQGDVILNSFAMLITGAIPADTHVDELREALIYTSVLVFTVFFLNIFIGVIGENYSIQKGISVLVFQKVRANMCFEFLLRASVVPCWLLSRPAALGATVAAGAVALAVQTVRLAQVVREVPHSPSIFVLCQLVMLLSSYQGPCAPWGQRTGGAPKEPQYLWFAEACRAGQASQLDAIQDCLEEVRGMVGRLESQSPKTQRRVASAPVPSLIRQGGA